jgi:anti-sigma factor RsiW
MDCEHTKQLLLSYIDDEIDDDERKLVEVHLSGCAECTAEMEALALTGSRLRQAYETVAAGAFPSAGVWQAIRNRMEANQPTGERDDDRIGSRWGWLFGWRHPVWRTAVAGAAMLSFMIVFAINNAPAPLWTVAEQKAIDIAVNDPAVQALLDGEGVVYEVVPVNGDGDARYYQVGFALVGEAESRSGTNSLRCENESGSLPWDSDSYVLSATKLFEDA